MFGAPKRLLAFGVCTFSTGITTSMVQDLNEKIACVDYPLGYTFRSSASFSPGNSDIKIKRNMPMHEFVTS
jgi:hypothetical protein